MTKIKNKIKKGFRPKRRIPTLREERLGHKVLMPSPGCAVTLVLGAASFIR